MKRIILHILIIVLTSGMVFANSDSLFVQANNLYSEGKFEEAISTYQEILDKGYESAELYYNMGNSAFRSNKVGYAVLYLEKALKADPGYEQAEKNLKYVSLYLEDKLESVPELFFKRWMKSFNSMFSLLTWSMISIILFIVLLISLLLYIFGARMLLKKSGFFIGVISLLLFVFAFNATIHSHKKVTQPENAVVLSPSVVVKSSPSDSGTDLFILHEGTRLITDETVGDWIEIKIIDGRVGWLRIKSLGVI